MRRKTTTGASGARAACAILVIGSACLAGAPRGTAEETSWPLNELPGCKDLPQRMAKYYKPVPVAVKPAVAPYKLPLDLSKLTNKDFASKMQELRNPALAAKAKDLLARNGFVALAGRHHDDVAKFYQGVKAHGLPLFITADAVLHLYRIHFDEVLREAEDRDLYGDALAVSRGIQAAALRLHGKVEDDLKEPVRLLVGYSTVPVILLTQTDLGAEARSATAEVQTWTAKPNWRQMYDFSRSYDELLSVMSRAHAVPKHQLLYEIKALRASLARYVKEHPVQAEPAGIPAICRNEVLQELDRIAAHQGPHPSPLFAYEEDYSQYVPRGHYTKTRKLKQYFKAVTWYGRMTFLLRGAVPPNTPGLVPLAEARKQTLAACILAGLMEQRPVRGSRYTLARMWTRLYAVTSYYRGLSDDLAPPEYRRILRDAFGGTVTASAMTNKANLFEIRRRLARIRKPAFYSRLHDVEAPGPLISDEQTLARALTMDQGLRLMGQRHMPDSFIMGRLVHPVVGEFTGKGLPFTFVAGPGGGGRGFPRGLDVMAALGSGRAEQWLTQLGDNAYRKYDETLAGLMERFDKIDQAGWNRNVYWSWMYVLKALLQERGTGYPTFMTTEAWRDKQLSTALASWAQLRYDAVLYTSQAYAPKVGTGTGRRSKTTIRGYVEPVPEFYARLLALNRMTYAGLTGLRAIHSAGRRRLMYLDKILLRLLSISKQELANQRLSSTDRQFIQTFGEYLQRAVAGTNKGGLKTTTVADVHTNAGTRAVLEEATGHLHPMIVVYPMRDGSLVAGVGPVLSHYEFRHPLSNRLIDESWKRLLRSVKRPKLPPWAETFTVQPQTPRRRSGGGSRYPGSLLPRP